MTGLDGLKEETKLHYGDRVRLKPTASRPLRDKFGDEVVRVRAIVHDGWIILERENEWDPMTATMADIEKVGR